MVDLPSLRRKYGPVFVTALDNGSTIPWTQLTVGEYLEYSNLLEGQVYARATIEDEIFKKCVVDEYALDLMPELKAGTVSTVVQDIISNSGPSTINELNSTLGLFRGVAAQAVHQTTALIAQAFPAYKLEDIYDMNYGDFMLRLAQAESKLLQLGILEEPLHFNDPTAVEEPQAEEPPKKGAMDMYLDYLKQEQPAAPVAKKVPSNQTIISGVDAKSLEMEMIGHEKQDNVLEVNQMMKDASVIYKDYMDAVSSGQELEIKTPEERLAVAAERAAENKKNYDLATLQKQKAEKALEKKYAEIHKRFAAKKK